MKRLLILLAIALPCLAAYVVHMDTDANVVRILGMKLGFYPVVDCVVNMEPMISTNGLASGAVKRFDPFEVRLSPEETLAMGALNLAQVGISGTTNTITCQQVIDAMVKAGLVNRGYSVIGGAIVE